MTMISKLSGMLLIREGERRKVGYFLVLYAILGCGMAFGRNSADVLFFKRYGIEFLPVMYMVLSIFLAVLSAFYAAFADRVSPERLSLILFFTIICLLFGNWFWLSFSDASNAYPAYFLLYEVASELLIVHSIHYLSQNFDSLQAKRLFPLIMAGTQIGMIAGSLLLAVIAQYINIQDIMLAWCFLLLVPMIMIFTWHKKYGSSIYFRPLQKSSARFKQAISQISYGFTLIKTSRLLKAASFSLFCMVVMFYVLNYSINKIYTTTFESEAELTRFFGILSASTNSLALLLQIFITNRVIHRYGVKKVNLFFPVTSLFTFFTLLSSFTLVPAIIGSINKDTIMAAFRNPLRTIFISALPENVRGRANATSVVIVLPLALFFCGAMLLFMQNTESTVYFLVAGFIAAALYLYFNLKMNKFFISEMVATLKNKILLVDNPVPSPTHAQITSDYISGAKEFIKDDLINKLFNLFMLSCPDKVNEVLIDNYTNHENILAEKIIHILTPINPQGFAGLLNEMLEQTEEYLYAPALMALFKLKDKLVEKKIPLLLSEPDSKLQVAAIIGALNQDDSGLIDKAMEQWLALAGSKNSDKKLSALKLVECLHKIPDRHQVLLPLYKNMIDEILRHGTRAEKEVVLTILPDWPEPAYPEIADLVTKTYENGDTVIRQLCVRCSYLFYNEAQILLNKAIADSNRNIRQQAASVHYEMSGSEIKDILVLWLSSEANGTPQAQRAFLGLLHEIEVEAHDFKKIAKAKARHAQNLYLAFQLLKKYTGKQSASFELVKYIVQERIKEYINLSLYAMKGFENPEDTYVVWAGINSRDPRHIANACEVLRNFKSKELGEILSDLAGGNTQKLMSQKNVCFSENIKSVLSWCVSLPDAWLSICAKEALRSQD